MTKDQMRNLLLIARDAIEPFSNHKVGKFDDMPDSATIENTPYTLGHLRSAEDAFLRINRFLNGDNPFPEPVFDDDGRPTEAQEWRDFDKDC